MYEIAIIVAMIVGYLLGNSIDKKLDRDAKEDMKKRKEFGHGAISEKEIFDNIKYRSKK